MPRDLEAIQDETAKLERELATVRSKPSREEVEGNIVRHLAALRGSAYALVAHPEAIASGSAVADFDRALALATYVALTGDLAREAVYAHCRPVLATAQTAKDKAKSISGLQSKLDRLRREAHDVELAEARAEIERRAEQYAAADA